MFELKKLSREAIPRALEKAERYRLLNEPVEAESICRDVLEVDPDNAAARVTLLLALSDQLGEHPQADHEAKRVLAELTDPYARSYYAGLLCERRAKAALARSSPGSGHLAYEWIREAMEHYDEAAKIRPAGNDDALLRWNTCVRILTHRNGVEPLPKESFHPLLE
jgi:tetratricopeptide (TPR) repeat protein